MQRSWKIAFVLVSLSAAPAYATDGDWGHLYTGLAITTDYRFDGMSSSNRQPALQSGLHWALPDGFYTGLFATSVRFQDERRTSYELDWYGGKHLDFDGNDLNLQVLYSTFPNQSAHAAYAGPSYIFPTYNFLEGSAELSHAFGAFTLAGKVLWSPSYSSDTGTLWSTQTTGTYVITSWLKVDASVAQRWLAHGWDRTSWNAGATATWKILSLDLRYYDTSSGRAECYGTNWCGAAYVAKIAFVFPVF